MSFGQEIIRFPKSNSMFSLFKLSYQITLTVSSMEARRRPLWGETGNINVKYSIKFAYLDKTDMCFSIVTSNAQAPMT